MSRSIHETRQEWHRLAGTDFSDPEAKSVELESIRNQLHKKRSIKTSVANRRALPSMPVMPTLPEALPIRVLDDGTFVHYPASPSDIQGIMRLLPKGVLDGLTSITLGLGTEHQSVPEGPVVAETTDPFTGRESCKFWQGVYCGDTTGIYSSNSRSIQIFAYVYDPEAPLRELWEIYLRLRMLRTFVHEVAHHYDGVSRVARGRWLTDDDEKAEIYAQQMAFQWLTGIVVPFLERSYPTEVGRLCDWIRHQGGISVSLARLAGDPRELVKGGLVSVSSLFGVDTAFEGLVDDAVAGKGIKEMRLTFARNLHYGDNYEEALQILNDLLREDPSYREAMVMRADVLEHLDRHEEAIGLVEEVLRQDAQCADAWDVLVDARESLGDWAGVVEAVTHLLDVENGYPSAKRWALLSRARARVELGDLVSAEEDLDTLYDVPNSSIRRLAAELRVRLGTLKQSSS